ncbi:MAG: MBOAT family protein [Bacteroidales bacterium]|nr:MBOAT family protein [Bacteroidales bacterium]
MEFLKNLGDIFLYNPDRPMLFNSGAFLLFFSVFIMIYTIVYKKRLMISIYIILFSLFFYYKSSGIYFLLLVLTSITDFSFAWFLSKSSKKHWRTFWMIMGVIPSLGLLGYFKYTNFLLFNWELISGNNFQPLDIFLPVGISFYTFQSVSYVLDVYWGKLKPTKNMLDYAFFLSFFPQLVAGPIVKAHHFLPQLEKTPQVDKKAVYTGLWLVMLGLFKKAVIADYIAQYNDLIFAAPDTYNGFENLMAIYGYTLQIYLDFSGYSDMAIGFGRIMGFDLGVNFMLPYQAKSITDFWRRWHISLSTWLRDYLYIPLGGNRKGNFRTYANNMITMLLGGLWHGANWKFVFWGAMHGIGLAIHKSTKKAMEKIPDIFPKKFVSWFITFHFVIFLWIFFRATDINRQEVVSVTENGVTTEMVQNVRIDAFVVSWMMIKQVFTDFDITFAVHFWDARMLWIILVLIGFSMHAVPLSWLDKISERFVKTPFILKIVIFTILIQLVIQLQNQDVQPFIYFQF